MSMNIKTLEVAGMLPAFIGLRNPMNSHHLQDSTIELQTDISKESGFNVIIGEADMKLAQKLVRAGSEHSKFLRQIQVWADINLPRYMHQEMDTYKFGTKNSASTMHKLFTKTPITLDVFEYNDLSKNALGLMVNELEYLRKQFLNYKANGDTEMADMILVTAKHILPEGFLQLRTWNTNYAELMNMYHQRKHHRLKKEWVETFCFWCESLPYFTELCIIPFVIEKKEV